MGERRDERRERRRKDGILKMMRDALKLAGSTMGDAQWLMQLLRKLLTEQFTPEEIQAAFNAMEDAGPKLLRLLALADALVGDLTPEQIKELRAAVIAKLDHDGDGDIDFDDIPWPGWLRTAWGWIKRFLPGKKSE